MIYNHRSVKVITSKPNCYYYKMNNLHFFENLPLVVLDNIISKLSQNEIINLAMSSQYMNEIVWSILSRESNSKIMEKYKLLVSAEKLFNINEFTPSDCDHTFLIFDLFYYSNFKLAEQIIQNINNEVMELSGLCYSLLVKNHYSFTSKYEYRKNWKYLKNHTVKLTYEPYYERIPLHYVDTINRFTNSISNQMILDLCDEIINCSNPKQNNYLFKLFDLYRQVYMCKQKKKYTYFDHRILKYIKYCLNIFLRREIGAYCWRFDALEPNYNIYDIPAWFEDKTNSNSECAKFLIQLKEAQPNNNNLDQEEKRRNASGKNYMLKDPEWIFPGLTHIDLSPLTTLVDLDVDLDLDLVCQHDECDYAFYYNTIPKYFNKYGKLRRRFITQKAIEHETETHNQRKNDSKIQKSIVRLQNRKNK